MLYNFHFQKKYPQGKLVRCIQGEILDIVVDIRIGSPTFGHTINVKLNQENKKQVCVPTGLAHGFSVLSETAEIINNVLVINLVENPTINDIEFIGNERFKKDELKKNYILRRRG